MSNHSFQMGSSVPALLAEEWLPSRTILPTFFEVFLVDQANKTLVRTMEDSIMMLRTRIHHIRMIYLRGEERKSESSSCSSSQTTTERLRRALWRSMLQILQQTDTLLTKYRAEILCSLRCSLECLSLSHNSATLAESMFGLKRSTVLLDGKLQSELQNRKRLAILSPLLSYLSLRLKEYIPRNRFQTLLSRIARFLLSTHQLSDVGFLYAYMIGRTHYTSTTNYLMRHVVRRITQAETTTSTSQQHAISSTKRAVVDRYQKHASKLLYATILLSYSLQVWSWYRQAAKIPDPPPTCADEANCGCPICGRIEMMDPTVVATTGFVYCNACITRHIRIHRTCPVTNVPNPQLRRLHEPI